MPRFRTVEKDERSSGVRRIYIIGAFFACCFGILISRAVVFHLKDNADLESVALRQYRTAVRESSMRGKILDATGREMAIDITVDSVFANPREISNPVDVSDKLAAALKIERAALLERLTAQRKFVWIKRRLDEAEAKTVKDMQIEGIYMMRENLRSYPNKSIGANVIGAVGYDSEPLGGVELYYDSTLSSRSESRDLRRDARGHLYLSPTDAAEDQPSLRNVQLTIDKTLQYIADRALSKGVETSHSKTGQAVVVDVNTGAILAMSNVPTFDPNDYEKYPLGSWRNSVIVDPHEPGSTFKVIIVSSALEAGVVKTADMFDCENGSIKIGINIVRDSHRHGRLSVADIIKVSSNIGAYKIEQKLGPARIYEAIRNFGFGSQNGIDLPGSTPGMLTNYKKWSPIQFATIAFGQGIAVTPLQMAMAFAAIANGGTLYKPFVVKRVLGDNGEVISETNPQVAATPIGAETARIMTGLLRRVTEQGGTGTLAYSLEYPVAGKTGTAQKADARTGGYAANRYYASFVGFAPADAPRIAIFVGLDEPRGQYYGGQVAAPVFRTIAEETLHYLKVPATLIKTASAATPAPEQAVAEMDEVPTLISEEQEAQKVVQHSDGNMRVPDFRGLTMRGVLAAAGSADIELRFKGTGVAVAQSPEPGSELGVGEQCMVEFKPLM